MATLALILAIFAGISSVVALCKYDAALKAAQTANSRVDTQYQAIRGLYEERTFWGTINDSFKTAMNSRLSELEGAQEGLTATQATIMKDLVELQNDLVLTALEKKTRP